MPSPGTRTSARETILGAAASIAREQGVLGLSVDRICELAGVSKGGFFYHFPTKDALVEAVITSELDRFEASIEAHVEQGCSYAEGFVESMLAFVATNGEMMGSVNAALASGAAIRTIVVRRHDAWLKRLKKELPGHKYVLLALAADGLIFSCSLRDAPPTKADQAVTRRVLRELIA